jgi:hypothetical protein
MLHFLLDTNTCIDVIKQWPQHELGRFNRHAGYMAISAITSDTESKQLAFGLPVTSCASCATTAPTGTNGWRNREPHATPALLLTQAAVLQKVA